MDHESLAYFLDRRGAADLAVATLTGPLSGDDG
jgi:hypothetical protein